MSEEEKKNRTLFVRADATAEIGTGHVMRCIAFGQAWKGQGGRVIFFTHCESIVLQQFIRDEGFELVEVDKKHPDPFDLVQFESFLQQYDETPVRIWVVLDGYHFTLDYQKKIRNTGCRLMVIDDYNHLPEYYADILLNQNVGAKQINYNCNSDCVKLLGYKYALLRRDFLQFKRRESKVQEKAGQILVTIGGADPENVTETVIKAIVAVNDPELHVKVVVGPANPNIELLKNVLTRTSCNIELLHGPDMPTIMDWADFAISAGGSTVWELCYFDVPMALVSIAENQIRIVEGLQEEGAAISLGGHDELDRDELSRQLQKLINDRNLRASMSGTAQSLVDGNGCKRVSAYLRRELFA